MNKILFTLVLGALALPAMAAPIGAYTQWTSFSLSGSSEASGITYNRDTDSLYVVGDEGGAIVRYTKTGLMLDQFTMLGPTAKPDTEGITYLGGGQFLIADERMQTGYVYTYAAGTLGDYSSAHVFGGVVGNIGLEGVAFDPLTNSVWGVKETGPQATYLMTNFGLANEAVTLNPGAPGGLHPSRLGLTDLSDIYAMSASSSLLGTTQEMNLLILSQEANKIIEVTRTGSIVSSLDISFLGSHSIEGITMDDHGVLYLSAEDTLAGGGSTLYVLQTVPEPSSAFLLGGGLALVGGWRKRRRRS